MPWKCEKCGKRLGTFLNFPKSSNLAIWDNEDAFVSMLGVNGQIYKVAFLKMEAECECGHNNVLENESALMKLNAKPIGIERSSIGESKFNHPYRMSDKIEEVFSHESSRKFFMSEKSKIALLRGLSEKDRTILKRYIAGENIHEISQNTNQAEKQVEIRLRKIISEQIKPITDKEMEEEIKFIMQEIQE